MESVRKRCRRLAAFVREAFAIIAPPPQEPYKHGWHIDFICEHLEAITFGKFLVMGQDNRAVFNIPPSFSKSVIVSVLWPSWEWGPAGMPHQTYIVTAFREDFCKRDTRKMRTLVLSDWYQRHWPLRLTHEGEKYIANDRGGSREAVPFGSLMGGKAHRLIIDDPHSIDKAESDADRERSEIRFRESATLRMADPVTSAIVLIMQRLHENDLTGVILRLKLPYVHVMLPMRFEPDRKCVTLLGQDRRTIEGELLFPERFPKEVVERDEGTMTAYAIAAQHQQRPQPRGGLTFKRWWFKPVKAVPARCRWVRGWDLAASETKTSAFTAGVLLGYDPQERRYYVGDVVRERVSNPEGMIVRVAQDDGRTVAISLPQDPGAAGKVQAAALVGALAGFNASASPEGGDKVTRALPVAAQAEVGNVSYVEGKPWNEPFLSEIETFPTGAFLDQVDALSRAFAYFVLRGGAVIGAPIVVSAPLVIPGTNEGPQ